MRVAWLLQFSLHITRDTHGGGAAYAVFEGEPAVQKSLDQFQIADGEPGGAHGNGGAAARKILQLEVNGRSTLLMNAEGACNVFAHAAMFRADSPADQSDNVDPGQLIDRAQQI